MGPRGGQAGFTALAAGRVFESANNRQRVLTITGILNDEASPAPPEALVKYGVHFILRNEVCTGTLVWSTPAKDNVDPVRMERAPPSSQRPTPAA